MKKNETIIFHVDANSAYLSWTAADLLNRGRSRDIRQIPSAIAGDPSHRHGVILARSLPAKRYGVVTGDSLFEARQKCPELLVFPPDYELYMDCSQAMYEILTEYSPKVQRYSIDECFLELSESDGGEIGREDRIRRAALKKGEKIKERIHRELGFTVNVGVGPNKLLAKMAGELRKPNVLETIWKEEIPKKLWPLPVRELFMVGRASEQKLKAANINTIGELARADPVYLKSVLKSHGMLIQRYAWGADEEPVIAAEDLPQKGVGNSVTLKYDMTEEREITSVLLALSERVGQRLRRLKQTASLVRVSVKNQGFIRYSHQKNLLYDTECTGEIYRQACRLFLDSWKGEPVRQLGVAVSGLSPARQRQLSLFELQEEREKMAEVAVDRIRKRFGNGAVMRGVFANTEVAPMQGGVCEGNYIIMGGYEQ